MPRVQNNHHVNTATRIDLPSYHCRRALARVAATAHSNVVTVPGVLGWLPLLVCWVQGAHTHKPVAAGAIYYEPDDADDFDDEDPDDDLDI